MPKRIFITGIGTDVGKTLVAAIVCQSLRADYWKPIQAGDVLSGDKHVIQSLVKNSQTKIHKNSYALTQPMSPHAAAKLDGVLIKSEMINEPKTQNTLVIEGAGGILVPLNKQQTVLDLIKPHYHVIVVSQHYLGSINHSLMTIKILQQAGFEPLLIFNGDKNEETESIIVETTGVKVLARISQEPEINPNIVDHYAQQLHSTLITL